MDGAESAALELGICGQNLGSKTREMQGRSGKFGGRLAVQVPDTGGFRMMQV